MTAPATVHLGYVVGTGEPVAVPVQHLAVTGQTQMSGKTTTLEALVSRSGLSAVAFVTKRAEASFAAAHHQLAPYFRERADWQFVSAVLEATLRERLKFERSWIMRACKGATKLSAVQKNVRRAMDKAKGLSADVYMTLDHYLDIVIPQIDRLPYTSTLTLAPGLNVMDLSAYTTELQSLVIRSVIEWVYEEGSNVLVIIPEAWEFIPQNRGSPVLLACEQLIRKGGAAKNFVWLDSQDIAGVHKNILRQVGVWILGVQREAHEVKRALAHMHIPGKKPTISDVMQLERGQFFACFGRTVVKVYVQPAWLDNANARLVALGERPIWVPPLAPERDLNEEMMDCYQRGNVPAKEGAVDESEARALREENARLKGQVSRLELALSEMRDELRDLRDTFDPPDVPHDPGGRPMRMPTPNAPPATPKPPLPPAHEGAGPRSSHGDIDWIYACVRERALADGDPKMLALFQRVNEIEVTKQVERIKIDYNSQPGVIAALIAEGFFGLETPVRPSEVISELKRRGRAVHPANVSRDLGRLTEQGFLTRESDGYRVVPGMKVNIVEA